jgi:hypothetical protein
LIWPDVYFAEIPLHLGQLLSRVVELIGGCISLRSQVIDDLNLRINRTLPSQFRLLAMDRVVHLLSVDRHVSRCFDSEPNDFAVADIDNHDGDIVTNENLLILLPG